MSGFPEGAESWDITSDEREALCARINRALGNIATLPHIGAAYVERTRSGRSILEYALASFTGKIETEAVQALSDNRLPRVIAFGEQVGRLEGFVMAGQKITATHMTARLKGNAVHFNLTEKAERELPHWKALPVEGLLAGELRVVEFSLPTTPEDSDFYTHAPKTHPLRLGESVLDMDDQLTAIETAFAAFDATLAENS